MAMTETNFHDIRRNFILSSIFLILFLLYGEKIEIEQLLIFKFNPDGNWAIISPYWDIFLILGSFFLYTLLRYLIYGISDIQKNRYSQLLLIDILTNAIGEGGSWYKSITGNKSTGGEILYDRITIDNSQTINSSRILICGGINTIDKKYLFPHDIHNLKIKNDRICFSDIEIIFTSNNIKKLYGSGILKRILRKDFSDFIWPLFLIIFIIFLVIIKLTLFIYQ